MEDDQNPNRPDICIGTDDFHTDRALCATAENAFKRAGLSVEFNRPFAGSIVPAKHHRAAKAVQSFMIEINRRRYMDEKTGETLRGFKDFKAWFQSGRDGLITIIAEGAVSSAVKPNDSPGVLDCKLRTRPPATPGHRGLRSCRSAPSN